MAITRQPLNIARHIVEIIETLQEADFEAYVVGGAVRDLLLNRTPKDYDLSTSATPEEVRRVFGRKKIRIIGRRFRLAHLHHGREIIEISTFRRIPDRKAQDVRIKEKLGDVPDNMIFSDNEFGTAREDAERRDFTINALFYDPIAEELLDFTEKGSADVRNRLVRAIGNPEVRFEEDPVRILRALKFAGQCGMTLEPETEAALIKTMPLINLAAPSRMTLEFEKILKNHAGHDIFTMFRRYGFLAYFLPQIDRHWETTGEAGIKLLAERNRRVEAGQYRDSVSLAMALLLLPQVEARFGKLEPEMDWFAESREVFEDEIFQMLKTYFFPHNPIKALAFSTQRIMQVLPEMWNFDKIGRVMEPPAYLHARELMFIVNSLRWQRDDLEKKLPPAEIVIEKLAQKKQHQRHHRHPGRHHPASQRQNRHSG